MRTSEYDACSTENLLVLLEKYLLQSDSPSLLALEQWHRTKSSDLIESVCMQELIAVALQISNGDYLSAMTFLQAQNVFEYLSKCDREHVHIAVAVSEVLSLIVRDSEIPVFAAYRLLFLGIAALNVFIQANYTGPEFEDSDVIDLSQTLQKGLGSGDSGSLSLSIFNALQADGEMPFTICAYPEFLLFARSILHFVGNFDRPCYSHSSAETEEMESTHGLSDTADIVSIICSARWWNARAATAHQRLLISNVSSNTLYNEVRHCFQSMFACSQTWINSNNSDDRLLLARMHIEYGLAQHFFGKADGGLSSFETAQSITNLKMRLTGCLGKKTKFQQRDIAQMVLHATSESGMHMSDTVYPKHDAKVTDSALSLLQSGEAVYRDIRLDQADSDNILLENIVFDRDTAFKQENLSITDQLIVLALFLNKKSATPNDVLSHEELSPYITRILENPNNWMVYSTALLERAWLECDTSKRRERAVLQMQALVDQHTKRLTITQSCSMTIEESACASERIAFVYALAFPPRYALKKDLAQRYFAFHIMKSALLLFEELQLWDDVIACYQILDQNEKAKALVRERIEIAPTPYLYCCLGDLTGDIAQYERAWTLSQQRYSRAKRSLGKHAFQQRDFEAAKRHYQDSVRISPMHVASWFQLGVIGMQTEQWSLGLHSFTRVVQLDPENGEAWGNVGSIHMMGGRYAEAFSVFQEALKQKRHMWQMWENFSICAMETKKFGDAMYAMEQLIELRDKHQKPVDHEILAWLIDEIVYKRNFASADEKETSGSAFSSYQQQLGKLLDHITCITTSNAKVWQIYAHFYDGIGEQEKALDCRNKQCRTLQQADWFRDEKQVTRVCAAANELANGYIALNSKKALHSCRLYIRGIVRKVQMDYAELDVFQALVKKLKEVEELEMQM